MSIIIKIDQKDWRLVKKASDPKVRIKSSFTDFDLWTVRSEMKHEVAWEAFMKVTLHGKKDDFIMEVKGNHQIFDKTKDENKDAIEYF